MPEEAVYLPVGVQRLRVYGLPSGPLWAHARLVEQTPAGVAADVHLLDESGRVVVEVQRFRARVLDAAPQRTPEPVENTLYAVAWQPSETEDAEAVGAGGRG